jgi:membrane protein implicated in regulation of membrane protease activity
MVIKDVIPEKPGGKVEFKGAEWSAVSNEYIKNGDWAIITEIDGITLKIKRK